MSSNTENSALPDDTHTSSPTSADRYRNDPRPVRIIKHTRIPLSDGVELAARVWLPEDLGDEAVPAVLEYIPYRKNDMTAGRDDTIHPEFARAGYASVRVDLRGCGDSTGVMTDEYSATELDDGLQVLKWIAAQDWCSGKVGVIGKSWGGFNGLQLAALQPPELAAVITICSTDDRYADDVHYNGGTIVGDQMLSWASTMWAYNARPQDPAIMGDGWQEDWKRRIDEAGMAALMSALGSDLAELNAGVDQLIEDTEGTITAEVVDQYYGGRVEATGFKVADAAVAGDAKNALSLLRHALSTGSDPVPLVAAVAMKLRGMAKVQGFSGTSGELASELKMAPWQVDRARREVRRWNEVALGQSLIAAAEADAAVKGGGRDPVYAVEWFVSEVARLARQR